MTSITDILGALKKKHDDLKVVIASGSENYKRATSALKRDENPAVVVWGTVDDGTELLRYPFLDVEINVRNGKTGISGKPSDCKTFLDMLAPT
jgi:hypothetical protein